MGSEVAALQLCPRTPVRGQGLARSQDQGENRGPGGRGACAVQGAWCRGAWLRKVVLSRRALGPETAASESCRVRL